MSIHIKLKDHQEDRLRIFANKRKSNMSAVIRYSLDKLFEDEDPDPRLENVLRTIIDPVFKIPRGYTIRSFYLNLLMLSSNYPEGSSRSYWKQGVYIGTEDMTHREVIKYIESSKKDVLDG